MTGTNDIEGDLLARARAALAEAEALCVTAGAGMGVDSGLPDFRGNEGFWRAYPPFAKLGLGFMSLANPQWFERDPSLAWGFYGHRLELYRRTEPHAGFDRLLRHGAGLQNGVHVFTSNVDGQFQRAGFAADSVCEVHGSIHHLQCIEPCGTSDPIWPCREHISVDPETMRAAEPWPRCPGCGGLARPNILMFSDWSWLPERSSAQEERLSSWLARAGRGRLVIVELGAGTAVPSVRNFSEGVAARFGGTLIRINPREAHGPAGTLSLAMGARAALELLLPDDQP